MSGMRTTGIKRALQFSAVVFALAWSTISDGHAQEPAVMPKPAVHVYDEGGVFYGLVFSQDGQRVWNIVLDSWNVLTGEKYAGAEFEEGEIPVAMDLSLDGSRIVTASILPRKRTLTRKVSTDEWATRIRLWDARRMRVLSVFKEANGRPGGVRFLGNDKSIGVWYREPPRIIISDTKFNARERYNISIASDIDSGSLDENGRFFGIAQMHMDRVVLWNIAANKEEQVIAHESPMSIAFDTQRRLLATGGADNCARVWDIATGAQLHVLKGHGEGNVFMPTGIYSLSFDRTGKLLASGGHDGRVIVWDTEMGKPHFEAQISTQPIVQSVAFSPDSRQLAAGYMGVKSEAGFCIWQIPGRAEPVDVE